MTSHEDEKELDDYLQRGSAESRRYRALGQEEPPADLDRAVLAQARAAVASETLQASPQAPPSRSFKRTQWMVPFALAASVLLTFAIFREGGDETGVTFEAPLAPANAPMTPELPKEREVRAADAATDDGAEGAGAGAAEEKASTSAERNLLAPAPPQARREASVARDEAPAQAGGAGASAPAIASPQPVPPAAAAPPPASESASSVATFSGPRATVPPLQARQRAATESANAAAQQDVAATQESVRTPEVWLEDIRKLRVANQTAEADAELLLFMVAYPDYFQQNPGAARP